MDILKIFLWLMLLVIGLGFLNSQYKTWGIMIVVFILYTVFENMRKIAKLEREAYWMSQALFDKEERDRLKGQGCFFNYIMNKLLKNEIKKSMTSEKISPTI
jgi:hypothetical protein